MKMKLLLMLVFFTACLGQGLRAQAPVVKWNKTIGGSAYDQLNSLERTVDGGFLLGGFSDSGKGHEKSEASKGATDFWVVKIDTNGIKKWDKTIGGLGGDYLKTAKQTTDGGYILGGWSQSGIGGDKTQSTHGWDDYWVVKLDSSRAIVWDKRYGGTSQDLLQAIHQTPDGNYLLAGMSDSPAGFEKSANNFGTSGRDFWLLKIDQQGNKLWDKTIGSAQDDHSPVLLPCADGSFLLGGSAITGGGGNKTNPGYGKEDYWILKLDANGNMLWEKTFGGSETDILGAIEQTADGGFLIGGNSYSGISGDKSQAARGASDFWVLKLDAAGNKLWDKTFGGLATERLTGIRETRGKDILLTGTSFSGAGGDKTEGNNGISDYWMVKTDAAGNLLWNRTIGSFSTEELNGVLLLDNTSFIIAGASDSQANWIKSEASRGIYDFWVVKLVSPCALLEANLITRCGNGQASAEIKVQGNGNNPWKLTFSLNGTTQALTRTGSSYVFPVNWPGGTEIRLLEIEAGTCRKTLDYSFTFPPVPAAPQVKAAGKCWPETGVLQAFGIPAGGTYLWYKEPTGGTPFLTDSIGAFAVSNLKEPTLYYVAGRNQMGCEGPRTQVLVNLNPCPPVYIPNIITQNSDGKNDTFKPVNLAEGTWSLQVFNRWGKQLYQSENYQHTWPEGKVKAGTYYYLLQHAETNQQYKGWLEVME